MTTKLFAYVVKKKKRVQRLFFSFHPPWSSNHKTLLLKNSEKVRQLLVRDFQKVHSAIAIQSSSKKASPSRALSLMLQPKFANFFAVGCKQCRHNRTFLEICISVTRIWGRRPNSIWLYLTIFGGKVHDWAI